MPSKNACYVKDSLALSSEHVIGLQKIRVTRGCASWLMPHSLRCYLAREGAEIFKDGERIVEPLSAWMRLR